jgi:hypothetical protein
MQWLYFNITVSSHIFRGQEDKRFSFFFILGAGKVQTQGPWQYCDKQNILCAIIAVKNGASSQKMLTKLYGIPRRETFNQERPLHDKEPDF